MHKVIHFEFSFGTEMINILKIYILINVLNFLSVINSEYMFIKIDIF